MLMTKQVITSQDLCASAKYTMPAMQQNVLKNKNVKKKGSSLSLQATSTSANIQTHEQIITKLARPLGVKLVIDHFGHPQRGKGAACEGFQAMMRAVDNGRTWVKLSAGYRLESPQVAQDCARALLARVGPERLLWGSDWPFAAFEDSMRYETAIASFRLWVPDANMRRIISGETPFRLYFT